MLAGAIGSAGHELVIQDFLNQAERSAGECLVGLLMPFVSLTMAAEGEVAPDYVVAGVERAFGARPVERRKHIRSTDAVGVAPLIPDLPRPIASLTARPRSWQAWRRQDQSLQGQSPEQPRGPNTLSTTIHLSTTPQPGTTRLPERHQGNEKRLRHGSVPCGQFAANRALQACRSGISIADFAGSLSIDHDPPNWLYSTGFFPAWPRW